MSRNNDKEIQNSEKNRGGKRDRDLSPVLPLAINGISIGSNPALISFLGCQPKCSFTYYYSDFEGWEFFSPILQKWYGSWSFIF